MDKATKIKHDIESLCIYDIKDDEIVNALYELLDSVNDGLVLKKQGDFFRTMSHHSSLRHHISRLILTDDNVFSRSAAAGKCDELSPSVMQAVKSDLAKLEEISLISAQDIAQAVSDSEMRELFLEMPAWESNALPSAPFKENWAEQIDELIEFHKENGYGKYAKYAAFTWRDRELVPISALDGIRLTDLKNYETQREQVVENTRAFLDGFPANNVLLYGDRGTGKSSTIHAILNEYRNKGLRMIEISKGDIGDLTMIREQISQSPMKFIIYIDDLSFDSHDDSFGELKAALEGSLSGRQSNTLIYATSNRRHLIKENFNERENDVHRADTMQEELSLSDRFGLSITFINPDKKDYFDIVTKIAADRGLEAEANKLCEKAEVWARRRGGRSPRCARQFIDYAEACIKRGREW